MPISRFNRKYFCKISPPSRENHLVGYPVHIGARDVRGPQKKLNYEYRKRVRTHSCAYRLLAIADRLSHLCLRTGIRKVCATAPTGIYPNQSEPIRTPEIFSNGLPTPIPNTSPMNSTALRDPTSLHPSSSIPQHVGKCRHMSLNVGKCRLKK